MAEQQSQGSPRLVPISYHSATITDTPDIPVDLKGYERNVTKCKAFVGVFSLVGIFTNGAILRSYSKRLRGQVLWEGVDLAFEVSIQPAACAL